MYLGNSHPSATHEREELCTSVTAFEHPQITFQFTDSDIIDCNAVLMLHQMIADDYKEARTIWDGSAERCSDFEIHRPNRTQLTIEDYLVESGFLDEPEVQEEEEPTPDPEPEPEPEPPRSSPKWRRLLPLKLSLSFLSLSSRKFKRFKTTDSISSSFSSLSLFSPSRLWDAMSRRSSRSSSTGKTSIDSTIDSPRSTIMGTGSPLGEETKPHRRCLSDGDINNAKSAVRFLTGDPNVDRALSRPRRTTIDNATVYAHSRPTQLNRLASSPPPARRTAPTRTTTLGHRVSPDLEIVSLPWPTSLDRTGTRRSLGRSCSQYSQNTREINDNNGRLLSATTFLRRRRSKTPVIPPRVPLPVSRWYHLVLVTFMWEVLLGCFLMFGFVRMVMRVLVG